MIYCHLLLLIGKGQTMRSTLDKFGRVVIPKAVRDDLHLTPGTVLEIREHEGRVVLEPAWEKPSLIRKSGVLVFTGEATGDLVHAVDRDRGDRLVRAAGLRMRPEPSGR